MYLLICAALSGSVMCAGENVVGRKDPISKPTICLSGLSIQKSHAIFERDGDTIVLKPGVVGAKTKVLTEFVSEFYYLRFKNKVIFYP